MKYLKLYDQEILRSFTRLRSGETKLGERVQVISEPEALASTNCKFVLIGLPEDIGVKANFGKTGTKSAWNAALKSILNIQSTDKFRGDELLVLGHINFDEELRQAEFLDPDNETERKELMDLIITVDEKVEPVIRMIFAAGKIPIVIGGGHNNSFPIIKAFSGLFDKPVNVINLDAHADFRPAEGRHSGNGFNYALRGNYLAKYAMIGLHEDYNSQSVVGQLKSQTDHFQLHFLEDIIRGSENHNNAFQRAMDFTEGLCGLEIDMDSIAGALSSAVSPCGFTLFQVREMIAKTSSRQIFYLHIAEGASQMDDGKESDQTGKSIACLVSDFIKAQK